MRYRADRNAGGGLPLCGAGVLRPDSGGREAGRLFPLRPGRDEAGPAPEGSAGLRGRGYLHQDRDKSKSLEPAL